MGSVVWGRFSRARWWPAIVVPGRLLKRETRPGRNWIFWLSDNRISQVKSILTTTVLPAKGDSDIMFCLQSYQGLRIDRSLVY